MRKTFLLVLTIVAGGCTVSNHDSPAEGSDPTRWQIIALQPGPSGSNGNQAILLDSQTGDTWINNQGNLDTWQKMRK